MIKRSWVNVGDGDKLVIDSNKLVAKKLEEIISSGSYGRGSNPADGAGDEGFAEFTEGIFADKIEMLVGDEGEEADGASPSNIIKNDSPMISEEAISAAKAEADSIIADANEKAEAIIADAEAQSKSILEDSKKKGFNAGHDEGYNAGHDEGYQTGYQEAEALKAQYEEMIVALENDYQKKMEEMEPLFVDVLTDIYEHILHVNFSESKDVIFYLIQDAVKTVEENEGFIIHVSRDDYGFVSMQKKELLSGISNGDNVEIVEDMTLKSNECFIETGGGIFDCSLETQLAGLKRELRLLSYEKPDRNGEADG